MIPDMARWSAEPRPRKPTVIGIGAQKGGTSWLNAMLSQHPKLWGTPFKEVHFFDHRFKKPNREWTTWHIRSAARNLLAEYDKAQVGPPPEIRDYVRLITGDTMFSNGWYKELFAPAPKGTRPFDITPDYSGLPEEGVDFVARFLPKAQFIYILRHPVDRLISQLGMNMARQRKTPRTVDEWMAEIDDPVLYARGRYSEYVPRWNARFGPDRLLILPFGRIASQPLEFLREIETFLGLPAHDYKGAHKKVFAAKPGLSVPDALRDEIRARLRDELGFLSDSFDEDFVRACR